MELKDFFGGLIQYKKQCGVCEKTIREYQTHLNGTLSHSIADIDITDLKQVDVGKVLEAGRKHGIFGPQRSVVVFRQLLRFIKESGYKLDFDWRDISLPTAPRKKVEWLDKDEFEAVRNSFDLTAMSGLRDRALIEVLRATGMRISEALSLNRLDIDWIKKEAEITNCKTKEREMIYFNDEALAWLKRYMDSRNDRFEPVFVSYNGKRATPCSVRRTLHHSAKRAGIAKNIHPHLFRKTFCTELLHGLVDIKSVQALARHKSERTTLRYYVAISREGCKSEHQRVLNA